MAVVASGEMAVTPDLKGFEQKMSSSLGGLAKKAALAFGGAFAATKAVSFLGDAVGAARESNEIAAQTAAAIKSTGGAANVTAKQVDELSNSIARKTGIDDEQIAKASNLLLTFTNVKNAAGKNNDIFNQATQIAADMGKALGTDAAGSAIQLGKALNDPVKGITALTRVGVSFTDQQKQQIETLVKSGNTLGAQKIILGELNKEFGGSAEAGATATAKLKVTLGNLQEDLGNKLVPVIDKAAGFLADNLPGALDVAGKAFRKIADKVAPLIDAFLGGFANPDAINHVKGLEGRIIGFGATIRKVFEQYLKPAADWLQTHWKQALIVAGGAFLLLTGPITAVVVSIALLYARFQGVRDFIGAAVSYIVDKLRGFGAYVQEIFPQVQEAIGHFISVVMAMWHLFGDDILNVIKGVFEVVKTIVETAVNVIAGIIKFWLAVINGDWGKAWDALKGIVGAVWDGIKGVVKGALDALGGIFGAGLQLIETGWARVWGGLKGVVSGIWDGVMSVIRGGVNLVIDAINLLIKAYNLLPGHKDIDRIHHLLAPRKSAADLDFSGATGGPNGPQFFAEGGWVRGRLGSAQAAVLHAGEYVLSRAMLRQIMSGTASAPLPAYAGVGGSPLVGQMVIQGATFAGAERTAAATVRELRAEAWRQGK